MNTSPSIWYLKREGHLDIYQYLVSPHWKNLVKIFVNSYFSDCANGKIDPGYCLFNWSYLSCYKACNLQIHEKGKFKTPFPQLLPGAISLHESKPNMSKIQIKNSQKLQMAFFLQIKNHITIKKLTSSQCKQTFLQRCNPKKTLSNLKIRDLKWYLSKLPDKKFLNKTETRQQVLKRVPRWR